MALEAPETGDSVLLGSLGVQTDAAAIAEFAAALGLPPGSIPLTFPIRWLALPHVRAAIEGAIGLWPVHASQAFNFAAGLAANRDYALRTSIRQHRVPSHRIVVRSSVTGDDGRAIVQFETVLLPTSALSAAPMPNEYEPGGSSLADIEVGPIDTAQAARYAAATFDDSRLHSDPEFARSIGLDGPIVPGMLMMGLFQKALSEWAVGSYVSRLFSLFTQPVPVGSRLIISGRIVTPSKSKGADKQIIRLFVRTERDQVACIGEATLSAPPAAAASL